MKNMFKCKHNLSTLLFFNQKRNYKITKNELPHDMGVLYKITHDPSYDETKEAYVKRCVSELKELKKENYAQLNSVGTVITDPEKVDDISKMCIENPNGKGVLEHVSKYTLPGHIMCVDYETNELIDNRKIGPANLEDALKYIVKESLKSNTSIFSACLNKKYLPPIKGNWNGKVNKYKYHMFAAANDEDNCATGIQQSLGVGKNRSTMNPSATLVDVFENIVNVHFSHLENWKEISGEIQKICSDTGLSRSLQKVSNDEKVFIPSINVFPFKK